MDMANLINNISITQINISNLPKWKIINLHKQNKQLQKYIDELNNYDDIFNLTNAFINYIISIENKDILLNIDNIILINNSVRIKINDDKYVDYKPSHNEFFIMDTNNLSYSIYKNTKYSNKISKLWQPTISELKNIYLKSILYISSRL